MYSLWLRFRQHHGQLRVSALSFDTIFGLIPMLALMFVALKMAGLQHQLVPFMLRQLAGDSPEASARILEYVNNINIGSLGVFGLAAIILSVFSLLDTVSESFNAVWEVTENRSLIRRCSDYMILAVSAPVLLATAFGMTSVVQSQWLVQWLARHSYTGSGILTVFKLTPFFCSTIVLMLAYIVLPTVRVRFVYALAGGLLAGAFWQTAHWIYFSFQFGVARYNVIYGALALLPFLLFWIYSSWMIVLLGMEFVCYLQQTMSEKDSQAYSDNGVKQ